MFRIFFFHIFYVFRMCHVFQVISDWFSEFNDEQKNLVLRQLLVSSYHIHLHIIVMRHTKFLLSNQNNVRIALRRRTDFNVRAHKALPTYLPGTDN